MGCTYSYYKAEETYYPYLYCRITNKHCPYVKRCDKVEKFIHIDNFDEKECYEYIMEQQRNIPKDSYFVQTSRLNSKGKLYLYVIVDDKVERITTNLSTISQNYVYLKETIDGYQVSLTPFVEKSSKKVKNNV